MSLRDEAKSATKKPGTTMSTIRRLVESLEGEEREEVVSLIWDRDLDIGARAIGEVLTKHYGDRVGTISGGQVEDHRRGKPRPETVAATPPKRKRP